LINKKNHYKEHLRLISDKYISKLPTEELTTKNNSIFNYIKKPFKDLWPTHKNKVETMNNSDIKKPFKDLWQTHNNNVETMINSDRKPIQSD
jgi:hypothetical protein